MSYGEIWTAIGASAVFNTFVSFLLNGILGKKFENKNSIQLESIKASLEQELERAKHELQLAQAKLSVVYENQRLSFTKVIRAMDETICTLEDTYDYGSEEFSTISEDDADKFRRVRAAESLYTGSDGDETLSLFEQILSGTVGDRDNEGYVKDSELRWSLKQLRFVFKCTQEYFRHRIGLSADDHLLDIARLGACRLLNTISRGQTASRKDPRFDWDHYSTVEELIAVCTDQPDDLIAEMSRFIESLGDKQTNRSFYYGYLDEASRYKKRLGLAARLAD